MARNILYENIANDIKKKIFEDVYKVGSLLPTEIELEELYNVSKITIRNAIKILAQEGYVQKQSGRGTTILSNRLFNKLSTADSFSTMLENKGQKLKKHILNISDVQEKEVPVGFEISKLTGHITKIEKMYTLNDIPYILFVHYLPFEIDNSYKVKFEESSLYQVIKEKGEKPTKFHDTFSGYELSDEEKKILETSENIGIKRIRKTINNHNQMIEYSMGIYLTDMNPYEISYEI